MQAQRVPSGWRILSFPGISVTCTGTQELSLSGDEVNQQDNQVAHRPILAISIRITRPDSLTDCVTN